MLDEPQQTLPTCLYAGKHLKLLAQGHWEYAVRTVATGAVGIVATTDDDQVVLVEQYRIPAGRTVIEIPAGLVGDTADAQGESLLTAAQRELTEETGYESDDWSLLGEGYSSPGLTDESVTFYLARHARKTGPGEGDGTEQIVVHTVPLAQVDAWLADKVAQGIGCDFKLLAGLRLAETLQHRAT